MSPEEKELLRRSIQLAEENNDILRSIQRSMRLSRFLSLLYWVIIIGASIGAFYFVQPYIRSISDLYGAAQGQVNQVNTSSDDIQGILNKLKGN